MSEQLDRARALGAVVEPDHPFIRADSPGAYTYRCATCGRGVSHPRPTIDIDKLLAIAEAAKEASREWAVIGSGAGIDLDGMSAPAENLAQTLQDRGEG